MTANKIVAQPYPLWQRPGKQARRLPRPTMRLVEEPEREEQIAPGPRVAMRPAGELQAAQRRAKRRLLVIYGAVALVLMLGWLAQQGRALAAFVDAQPEPMTAPIVRVVGEHVFEEVPPVPELVQATEQRTALMSWYAPWKGGVNCFDFRNGRCVSPMASGIDWEPWVGRAAACPASIPFWSVIVLPGGEEFICLDRGGKIVETADGKLWIDLLVQSPPVPYGTEVPVTVRYPYWSDVQ